MKAALYLCGTLLFAVGCKARGTATAKVKDENPPEETAAEECTPAEDTWAGRMGMRLADDGEGGPVIDCTAPGTGLVHIGLRKGDRIAALNLGTAVTSTQDFETAATTLANDTEHRIQHWEFSVVRAGQQVTVKPKDEFSGCGLYVFDDCGPLEQ